VSTKLPAVEKEGGHGNVEWAVACSAAMTAFHHPIATFPPPMAAPEQGFRPRSPAPLKTTPSQKQQARHAVTADDVMTSSGCCSRCSSERICGPDQIGPVEALRIGKTPCAIISTTLTGHRPRPTGCSTDIEAPMRIRRAERKWAANGGASPASRQTPRLLRHPGTGFRTFIVEDSRGFKRPQPRQSVISLRGKILNVASATKDKLAGNQQISDLIQALGAGTGTSYREEDLRYGKVIIMTDADVDGAHIASLLITFFYRQMPLLIDQGHLYLAVPPLYRLTQGGKTTYARNDQHKDELLKRIGGGQSRSRELKGLKLASQPRKPPWTRPTALLK
jgi:topoisomerase-4 subunit B